jgi:hypothetical protein
MAVEYDLLTVVKTFEDAANRHAIDESMTMFSDDAGNFRDAHKIIRFVAVIKRNLQFHGRPEYFHENRSLACIQTNQGIHRSPAF